MHHGYAPLRKSCCTTPTTCVYLRSRVYKEPDRLASLDLYISRLLKSANSCPQTASLISAQLWLVIPTKKCSPFSLPDSNVETTPKNTDSPDNEILAKVSHRCPVNPQLSTPCPVWFNGFQSRLSCCAILCSLVFSLLHRLGVSRRPATRRRVSIGRRCWISVTWSGVSFPSRGTRGRFWETENKAHCCIGWAVASFAVPAANVNARDGYRSATDRKIACPLAQLWARHRWLCAYFRILHGLNAWRR